MALTNSDCASQLDMRAQAWSLGAVTSRPSLQRPICFGVADEDICHGPGVQHASVPAKATPGAKTWLTKAERRARRKFCENLGVCIYLSPALVYAMREE